MGDYMYIMDDSNNPTVVSKNNPVPTKATNATSSWTILNGTQLSTSYVDLEARPLVALSIPTGYAGGNITFQASASSDGTYQDVYDSNGILVSITIGGANRIVALTGYALQSLSSLRYVKVKCTTNVSANHTITSITKG